MEDTLFDSTLQKAFLILWEKRACRNEVNGSCLHHHYCCFQVCNWGKLKGWYNTGEQGRRCLRVIAGCIYTLLFGLLLELIILSGRYLVLNFLQLQIELSKENFGIICTLKGSHFKQGHIERI